MVLLLKMKFPCGNRVGKTRLVNERRFPSPGIPGFGLDFGALGDDDVDDPEHVEDRSLRKGIGEAKEEDYDGSEEVGHGSSFR
jgi:hypothetical protein